MMPRSSTHLELEPSSSLAAWAKAFDSLRVFFLLDESFLAGAAFA
jgi:hypothetical protein